MADIDPTAPIAETELSVPDMVCDGCAEKINDVLTAIPGVRSVRARLWRKRVRVFYEPSRVEAVQIKAALGAAGFDATDA